MTNQQDFFPEIDPKKQPQKPERIPNEEDCNEQEEWYCSCGEHIDSHSTKDLVECALNELRGETPKG
jgi:hypothetical protein